MTLLIASVIAEDSSELIACAEAAWSKGAEAVELRLDGLPGGSEAIRDYVVSRPERQFILTCRSKEQGGRFDGSDDQLFELLCPFIPLENVIFDVEFHPEAGDLHHVAVYATGETKGDVERPDHVGLEQWAKLQEALNTFMETGKLPAWLARPRHILSSHHFDDTRIDAGPVLELASLAGAAGGVAKIAYAAQHITDSFPALDLMRQHRDKIIAIAMGEDGLWTRVLAKKLGAFGTFASLELDAATAPGQLTVDEMIHRYRWAEINESTKVYGVIGDPVAHSLSPLLFNHWFAEHGINAVYLPLRVSGGDETLRQFLDECMVRPWLDIGGFSVTIPHKEAALAWLGNPSDNLTRSIGALNTLCFREGKAFGYNTDCYAAVASVAAALGRHATDLAGLHVHVLGAGGAARAILEGFAEAGCHITVFARAFAEAARLGEQFHCDAAPWDERGRQAADILINTTPVGMWPDVDESPMDDGNPRNRPIADGSRDQEVEGSRDQEVKGTRDQESVGRDVPADSLQSTIDTRHSTIPHDLSRYTLVFDLIYRPQETNLLRDARAAGCQTLNGLDMFIRQAAVQFELWTGAAPDLESARDFLGGCLL